MVPNLSAGKATVTFSVTWSNHYSLTYDGQAFKDVAWVFVKYSTQNGADGSWKHATLTTGGSATPSSDGKGAFVDPGSGQTLVWNLTADGVSNAYVKIKVGAIEMVQIPAGQYWYDVGGVGGSSSGNYGGGSESLVSDATQVPSGAAAGWPNGFSSFYLAKYEVSQGQYVDFLNNIPSSTASARWPNSYNQNRNTINYTATAAYGSRYSTTAPNRGANFLSTDDMWAYDSWAALRPMTEMEFEKAARGSSVGQTNKNVYPWGSNDPSSGDYATYAADGTTLSKYYANFNSTTSGPTDVGHYLSGDITRTSAQTGASPYGVTDLSGNDWEWLINCSWNQVPANGDGSVTPPASWPTGSASTKGFRGGAWYNSAADLRVSDRSSASYSYSGRDYGGIGGRPARTN